MKYLPFSVQASVLLILCAGIPPGFAQRLGPPPMRIAVSVMGNTVRVGERGELLVTFLDRNYRRTSNDRPRMISLMQEGPAPGGAPAGVVQIATSVAAAAGQVDLRVGFAAARPGRVLIHARSEGLMEGTALLVVTLRRASLSPVRQVWAQSRQTVEFIPTSGPKPANGVSPASFSITFTQPLPPWTIVRITSSPPCQLEYDGKTSAGFLDVSVGGGQLATKPVAARCSAPGKVRISVRLLPGSETAFGTLQFDEPQPDSLVFDEDNRAISLDTKSKQLRLHVEDQDLIAVAHLPNPVDVDVSHSQNGNTIVVEPRTITLTKEAPARDVRLSVSETPSIANVRVSAAVRDASLKGAWIDLTFESAIDSLKMDSLDEVEQGKPASVTVWFKKKDSSPAPAELERTVTFSATNGAFTLSNDGSGRCGGKADEKTDTLCDATVPQGRDQVTAWFKGAKAGVNADITASTALVQAGSVKALVVMAQWAALLIAFGAGTIGGLARYFYYRSESPSILPRKTARGYYPGLVGNAAFSGVFGLVLLVAALQGFVQESLVTSLHTAAHNFLGAFLIGIVGGFAGVSVLECLARVFGLVDWADRQAKRNSRLAAQH